MPTKVLILVGLFLATATAKEDLGARDADACAKSCVDGIFANPAQLNCAANDLGCICKAQPNLGFGIRDCIDQSCGLTGDALTAEHSVAESIADSSCQATATSTTGTETTTTAPTTTSDSATTTTTTPTEAATSATPAETSTTTTPTATTSSTTTTSTSSTSSTTTPSTNLAAVATTTSTSDSSTQASTTSTGASAETTTTKTSSATTALAAAATSGTLISHSSSNGLGTAAKAGIGAGIGVAVIMAAIIGCCLFLRRKQAKRQDQRISGWPSGNPTAQITPPLPGSGRYYPDDMKDPQIAGLPASWSTSMRSFHSRRSGYAQSRTSQTELESKSRRYEDMIQRTQPRFQI